MKQKIIEKILKDKDVDMILCSELTRQKIYNKYWELKNIFVPSVNDIWVSENVLIVKYIIK